MTPKEAFAKVMEASARDGGINTSDGVGALVDCMFITCRQSDTFDTDRELIDALALLTGMACAALLDYAKRLEEEGQ